MASRLANASARRGSVYVAVTGTAILVALMGFTALHLSRLEMRGAAAKDEMIVARRLALSSVELAIGRIQIDNSWRTNYTHGDENVVNPSAIPESLIFRFLDPVDGNLGNDSTESVVIQGIGRCGTAEFRYNVDYAPSASTAQQTNGVIYSYEGSENASEDCGAGEDRGQYFVPTLPSGATSFDITSVEIYLQQHGAQNGTVNIGLYQNDGGGNPGTLIQTVAYTETQLPTGAYAWHSVPYTSATGFAPGTSFCVTLEPSGSGNAITLPTRTGLSLTDSHFLTGNSGTWGGQDSTRSILLRVNGVYTTSTSSGPFTITPGSWERTVVP